MGRALGGMIVGLIVGGLCALAASANAPNDGGTYSRNILSLVIGAGTGAIAGAVIGGTHAIVEAIQRTRPSA